MTHIFQPLGLIVNGSTNFFLNNKFTERFAHNINEGLEEGKELEDIDIKLNVSVL